MYIEKYEKKKKWQKLYLKKKHELLRKISKKWVASSRKYEIRRKIMIFSESSFARITFLWKLRYDLYHCMFDMGFPTYLGNRLKLKKPHLSYSGDLIVGDYVQIADDCMIDYSGGVVLEDYARLSDHVTVYSHNHPVRKNRWDGMGPHHIKFSQVRICSYSWVGTGAIILPDCTYIGKYAVVAAGSVVTRNVPDYAIVAGNPARIVGYKDKRS